MIVGPKERKGVFAPPFLFVFIKVITMEFTKKYAKFIREEDDTRTYYCPDCKGELRYQSCLYCGILAEKDEDSMDLNTECEECQDKERWLTCDNCKLNIPFNQIEELQVIQ